MLWGLLPSNPVALRIRTFVPNTPLSCELSEVVIDVNLQELAPLFWRHLAEHRVRLPGSGGSCVPIRLQDFQQLCLFLREVESLRMRDFEGRWKAQADWLLGKPVDQDPLKECARSEVTLVRKIVETQ